MQGLEGGLVRVCLGSVPTAVKCGEDPWLLRMEVDAFHSLAASIQLTLQVEHGQSASFCSRFVVCMGWRGCGHERRWTSRQASTEPRLPIQTTIAAPKEATNLDVQLHDARMCRTISMAVAKANKLVKGEEVMSVVGLVRRGSVWLLLSWQPPCVEMAQVN